MLLRLIREPSKDGATMGVLFVDGAFFSFTVEDEIREVSGRPVSEWKIAGQTAIPAGTYRIEVTKSERFGRRLPLICDVPGFTGVRIHPGNSAKDSEGCLLPGLSRAKAMVLESRRAFEHLHALIETSTTPVEIRIENPQV